MFLARARQTHFSSYLPIYFRERQNIGKSFSIFHIATAFLICFWGRACESLSYVRNVSICCFTFRLPCCLCIKFQGIDFFRREIQNEISTQVSGSPDRTTKIEFQKIYASSSEYVHALYLKSNTKSNEFLD